MKTYKEAIQEAAIKRKNPDTTIEERIAYKEIIAFIYEKNIEDVSFNIFNTAKRF